MIADAVPHALGALRDWSDSLLPLFAVAALLWKPIHGVMRRFQSLVDATEENTRAIAELTKQIHPKDPKDDTHG